MIVVQVAKNNSLHIPDRPGSRRLNGLRQTVDALTPDPRRTLHNALRPVRDNILATACVEEDNSDVGVVEESRDHDQLAAVVLLRREMRREDVGAG